MQLFLLIKLVLLSTLELENLIEFIREETQTLNKSRHVPLSFGEWALRKGEVELASSPELKSTDKKMSYVKSELNKLFDQTKPQLLAHGSTVFNEKFKNFEAYQKQLEEILSEEVKRKQFYLDFQFTGQIKRLLDETKDNFNKFTRIKKAVQSSENPKEAFTGSLTEIVDSLNEAGTRLDSILKEKQDDLVENLNEWASGPLTKFNYEEDQELPDIRRLKNEIESTVNDSEAFILLVFDKKNDIRRF